MFLLTGGVGLENKLANPAPNWLSDKAWDEICRMCDLKGFQVVCMRERVSERKRERGCVCEREWERARVVCVCEKDSILCLF